MHQKSDAMAVSSVFEPITESTLVRYNPRVLVQKQHVKLKKQRVTPASSGEYYGSTIVHKNAVLKYESHCFCEHNFFYVTPCLSHLFC